MEEIKFVISELNKEPFNYSFNIVSYDSLSPEKRIEILFRVFKEIDPKVNFDVLHLNDPEEIVATVLETLRIMKYKPPSSINASEFRKAIVLGDRVLITNILFWFLSRMPALKKRAYLAQFLVKIELAPDIEGDNDILVLYDQYSKLIEEFKTVHTTHENLNKTINSFNELQKDVKEMEKEKEQISEKLVNIKRKVDPNLNPNLFSLAQTYRNEKEINEKLANQLYNLNSQINSINQNLSQITQEYKEHQTSYQTITTPEDLIIKMEDDIKIKNNLIQELLPRELEQTKRYVKDLQEIDFNPKLEQSYLDKVNSNINKLNAEINEYVEHKMLRKDPLDDKLTLFRQNASTVAEKRRSISNDLIASEEELGKLREKFKEKKAMFKGETPLKGEALKEYYNVLRSKSAAYKQKRDQLSEIKTVNDELIQKLDNLKAKEKDLFENLQKLEEEKGIPGYFLMKENSGTEIIDETKSKEEIETMIRKISDEINEKKALLAPKLKDIRPLRQQCQDLELELDKKKQLYNTQAVGLESKVNHLEQDVLKLKEAIQSKESEIYLLNCQIEVYEARKRMLEVKSEKSVLEKFEEEVRNEKVKNSEMKKHEKQYRENESENRKQLKMWQDLQALLEVKKKCLQNNLEKRKSSSSFHKSDFLML